jgi:hypothetical protein
MDKVQLYREIIWKFNTVLTLTDEINKELSQRLILKEKVLGVELTQDLKEKCTFYLTEAVSRNQF